MVKIKISYFYALIALLCCTQLVGQQNYFPTATTWERKAAVELGLDTAVLHQAVQFAMDNEYSGSRDLRVAILEGFAREPYHKILGPTKKRGGPAGLIIKDGYIVAEWGDINRVDMTFSVTKSYLSTVAGLAMDKGLLQVEAPVANAVWDGTFEGEHNQKVTWDHLLTQSSDWSGELFGVKDWADRPPRKGGVDDWKYRTLNEPGTVFEYNDVRVNVLAYALLQVWRKPLPMVLKEELMDKIGASTTWRWYGYDHSFTNVDGVQMQSVSGGGHSGGGVFINTLDHARFGLLFLNEGNWDGEQLLSKTWVEQVQQPSAANPNYGYMWWINNSEGQRYWKGVPEEVYYAAGFGGNYIVIDKAHNTVIVTRWLQPSKMAEFMKLVEDALN